MKYIITMFLTFLTLCSAAYANDDAERIVVDDTFENYQIGDRPEGWSGPDNRETGCFAEVVQDPVNPANKCIALHTKDTVESSFTRDFEAVGGLTTIECRAILADSKNKVHYMFWSREFMQPMVYKHGFTVTNSLGSNVIPNLTLDHEKWYDLKFVIDFNAQHISFFVDGMEAYSQIEFYTADQISINSIMFRFFYGPSYVDDFKVTTVGNISKLYTKLTSDKYNINGANREIMNVKRDTLLSDFMDSITFVDGAVVTLLDADGNPFNSTYVKYGMKIILESPNKKQRVEYVVKTRDWIMCKDTVEFLENAAVFTLDSPYVITHLDKRVINNIDKSTKVFEKDGAVYLPLRKLCDSFDIGVIYDGALNQVYVGNNITVPIRSNGYIKDEVFEEKAQASINENGVVFIPVLWAEEITGKKIVYNKDGLIILHENAFGGRQSVWEYIISEIAEIMAFN